MAQEFYMKISSVIEDVIRNKQHKIYKVSSSHTKIVQVMVSKDVISEWTHRYDFSIFIVCSSVLLRSTDDVHQDDCRWLLCMAIKKTPIQKLQYLWNGMRRLNSSSFGHVPISRIYQQYPALHHWQLHMTCFKVSTHYTRPWVTLESELSMQNHVNKVAQTCFYHILWLKQARKRKLHRSHAAAKLVASLVFSRLDYCNAILASLPRSTTAPCSKFRMLQPVLVT